MRRIERDVIINVYWYSSELSVILDPLLLFDDFASVLLSPEWVTGLSQGESRDEAASLMPLDLHAFLLECAPLAEWAQF